MLSIDANLLAYSYNQQAPQHQAAHRFLEHLSTRADVAISEFVLTEFYLLLRNPAILTHPLTARQAGGVIQSYRHHPRWKLLGFPPGSPELHDVLWKKASEPQFARRRIYDTRTALSLLAFGVDRFATANVKDFAEFPFAKVWNPIPSDAGIREDLAP